MKITKEYIETQIKNLKEQQEQNIANVNAVSGALQCYEQLLARLEEPDEVVSSDTEL